MKHFLKLVAALGLLHWATPAAADPPMYAKTVSSCGTPGSTPVAGNPQPITADTTGILCTSASGGGGGGTSSSFGSAFPATGTAAGFTDGTNMVGARTFDTDTGAGTENTLGAVIRLPGSGGSVAGGTSTNPVRVDPTGTTAQPASQSGTWNISNVSGTVSLPTGASTAALQGVQGTGLNPPTGGSGEIGFLSGIYNQIISTTAQAVAPQAQTTGGCTGYGFTSAATTNSTLISTGQHTLCSLTAINTTATVYYLRVYNTAAAPTCSSATGFLFSLPIPASATGAGAALPLGPFGMDFSAGLSFCLTGGGSSTDNTSAATGVYLVAAYK